MREIDLVCRYKGIGDVMLKKKPVARVRYDVCCRRVVDTARAGEEQLEQATVQPLIEGNIQVLKSQASLYTDELYTLHLEAKHGRQCDFYPQPIDVVTGVYQLKAHGAFRKFARR